MVKKATDALATVDPTTEGTGLALPADLSDFFQAENGLQDNLQYVDKPFFAISTNGKQFSIGGDKLIGDEGRTFDGHLLRICPIRGFYEEKYDPSNPTPPQCASIGGLVPDDSSREKQSPTCGTCKWNKWDTATGQDGKPSKGKACREHKRLVFNIPGVALPCLLSVPPTSQKAFSDFVKMATVLMDPAPPLWAYTIRVGFDRSPKLAFQKLTFEVISLERDMNTLLTLKGLRNSQLYINAERAYATAQEMAAEHDDSGAAGGQDGPGY